MFSAQKYSRSRHIFPKYPAHILHVSPIQGAWSRFLSRFIGRT